MRGQKLTATGNDLSYIFYCIRSERRANVRRSWQRRARIELKKLPFLTDAERHEIACVWSRRDCSSIDSPALRKLYNAASRSENYRKQPHQRTPASCYMRASFQANGAAKAKKKPEQVRPSAGAANDPIFRTQGTRQSSAFPCIPAQAAAHARVSFLHRLSLKDARTRHRGSDTPVFLTSDSRLRLFFPVMLPPAQRSQKREPKPRLLRIDSKFVAHRQIGKLMISYVRPSQIGTARTFAANRL